MNNPLLAPTGEYRTDVTEIIRSGYDFWCRQAGAREMPQWSDIDPSKMTALLPNVVVTHVQFDPLEFVERITGETVLSHNHQNSMHIPWRKFPGRGPDSEIWQQFARIVSRKKPSFDAVAYVGPHKEFLEVQVLRCPISDDGNIVNKVLSFVSYVSRT